MLIKHFGFGVNVSHFFGKKLLNGGEKEGYIHHSIFYQLLVAMHVY